MLSGFWGRRLLAVIRAVHGVDEVGSGSFAPVPLRRLQRSIQPFDRFCSTTLRKPISPHHTASSVRIVRLPCPGTRFTQWSNNSPILEPLMPRPLRSASFLAACSRPATPPKQINMCLYLGMGVEFDDERDDVISASGIPRSLVPKDTS